MIGLPPGFTFPHDAGHNRRVVRPVDLRQALRRSIGTPNDVALTLLDPLINGNREITGVSELFQPSWWRTIRRRGGQFIGTVDLTERDLSVNSMEEYFVSRLLCEVREKGGGAETWRGFLARTEFTRHGETFVQDIGPTANALRTVYIRIGDTLLTNGSGETGAWAAYNGATVTQDATWKTNGNYSIKITVADAVARGGVVQAGVTIAASALYILRLTLHIVSGRWLIGVYRTDTGEALTEYDTATDTGDYALELYLPDSNLYAGTVDLRVVSDGLAAGEINVDAGVFQRGPERAETKWYTDVTSIAMFGRKERIVLEGGLSNDAANNGTAGELIASAWPNPQPPRTWQTHNPDPKAPATLSLTFVGYWAQLNWLYSSLSGTRTNDAWVKALVALQTTVLPGIVDVNAAEFQIDENDYRRLGDLLKAVSDAGDAAGGRWGVGVYGRHLNYERIPEELTYYYAGGKLLDLQGGLVEPWLARPGWALWQDMPLSASLTSHQAHDPRWVYIEEIEMRPDGTIGISLDESGGVD